MSAYTEEQRLEELFKSRGFWIEEAELRVGQVVGRGAAGETYFGLYHGQRVAIKKYSKDIVDRDLLSVFTEMRFMLELRHENVCPSIGVVWRRSPRRMLLVSKFAVNGDLDNAIHGPGKLVRSLSFPQKLKLAIGIAQGLHYIHKFDIVHRDVKSANILLDADLTPLITDFGFSRFVDRMNTMTGETGSYRYMAPEVVRASRYTLKADMYSYAVLLNELLTEKKPFAGVHPYKAARIVAEGGGRPSLDGIEHPSLKKLIRACWQEAETRRPEWPLIIGVLNEVLDDISEASSVTASPQLDTQAAPAITPKRPAKAPVVADGTALSAEVHPDHTGDTARTDHPAGEEPGAIAGSDVAHRSASLVSSGAKSRTSQIEERSVSTQSGTLTDPRSSVSRGVTHSQATSSAVPIVYEATNNLHKAHGERGGGEAVLATTNAPSVERTAASKGRSSHVKTLAGEDDPALLAEQRMKQLEMVERRRHSAASRSTSRSASSQAAMTPRSQSRTRSHTSGRDDRVLQAMLWESMTQNAKPTSASNEAPSASAATFESESTTQNAKPILASNEAPSASAATFKSEQRQQPPDSSEITPSTPPQLAVKRYNDPSTSDGAAGDDAPMSRLVHPDGDSSAVRNVPAADAPSKPATAVQAVAHQADHDVGRTAPLPQWDEGIGSGAEPPQMGSSSPSNVLCTAPEGGNATEGGADNVNVEERRPHNFVQTPVQELTAPRGSTHAAAMFATGAESEEQPTYDVATVQNEQQTQLSYGATVAEKNPPAGLGATVAAEEPPREAPNAAAGSTSAPPNAQDMNVQRRAESSRADVVSPRTSKWRSWMCCA